MNIFCALLCSSSNWELYVNISVLLVSVFMVHEACIFYISYRFALTCRHDTGSQVWPYHADKPVLKLWM